MRGTTLYLLDTNTLACIADGRSKAARLTMNEAMQYSQLAISAITEAEILYGLARKPEAIRLRAGSELLLAQLQILPWDSEAAHAYGTLRASLTAAGKTLAAMDMLIAAHAVALSAILVTRDKVFSQVEALSGVVDWATDL